MKTIAALLALSCLSSALAAVGASQAFHDSNPTTRHRRHHARRNFDLTAPHKKRSSASKCSSSKKKKASPKVKSKAGASAGSSGNSTSTSSSSGCGSGFISVNGVCVGMLPDGGSDGGGQDTMAKLNSLVSTLDAKHKYFGQYAQAQSGTTFTGSQLLQVMDDLKASGAIFQPAVMPTGGWQGLTSDDDSQAQAICSVMKQFTDEGIEVWLRFGHEVNWYQTDGTYTGTASDFKAGWAAVAAACKSVAPEVKMFFTPNIASSDQYDEYFPDDPSTVDIIGIDYYPNQGSDLSTSFVTAMQPFHDKYCSSTTSFGIGETGLGFAGSAEQKTQWLEGMTSAKSDMKYLVGVSWFNYQKGYNFKVVDPDDSSTTSAFVSWAKGS